MSTGDYLFLKRKLQCPKCFTRRDGSTGFCHNCGVKIFANVNYDFKTFERDTSIRNWWAWHEENGFMFRDHFMIQSAKPLHRIQTIDKKALDPNYGRQTTPSEVAQAFKQKENRVRHRRTK